MEGSSSLPDASQRVAHNPKLAVDVDIADTWLTTNRTVTYPTTANNSVQNTTMPEVTAADRQKAFLDKASELYYDGKFKAALAAFKEASFQTCTEAMTNDLADPTLQGTAEMPLHQRCLGAVKEDGIES